MRLLNVEGGVHFSGPLLDRPRRALRMAKPPAATKETGRMPDTTPPHELRSATTASSKSGGSKWSIPDGWEGI